MTNAEKLSKAKAKLIMQQPFFAQLACTMEIIEDATLNPPTMATDGKVIYFHPTFVEGCNIEELVFTLCHEVSHKVFGHMFRRGQRDPKKWNIAGDFIINDLLVSDNIGSPPKGVLIDANLVKAGGGTTDGVYDLLPDNPSGNGGGSGQGSGGQSGGQGTGDKEGQWDDVRDTPGDAAERAAAEAEAKVAIAQAAQAAKMCGKLGANLARFVDLALKPKVDWKDVLRRFVSAKAKVERSYSRPKRRFLADDLYLPAMGGEALGTLCIAVDCSGSISQKEINEFAAELIAIKQDCRPYEMHILYFHHAISKVDSFGMDDELVIEPNGTGGTAFSPIFKEIADRDMGPVATVVLTDLCCNDFGPAPEYPVLWVSNHSDKAPWGEVVMMKSQI